MELSRNFCKPELLLDMPRGRPTKYTPEIAEKICQALRGGNFRITAAKWVGVSERTFENWLKQKPDFFRAVQEAEEAAEIHAVALVMKSARNDAKHAEWWLERKCHERWGRKDRVQVAGDPNAPMHHEIHVTYDNDATASDETDSSPS